MKNIIQLSVNRIYGKGVDLDNKENREMIEKYIVPVIEKNEGWGSVFVERNNLWTIDKELLQDTIDATLGTDEFCRCWVYLNDKQESVGLFQGRTENLDLKNVDLSLYEKDQNFSKAIEIISKTKIMSGCGIVLKPDLQGKGTGIADELYKLAKDYILFGWTSNPAVVAKRRKLGKTVFFPINSISDEYDLAASILAKWSFTTWSNDSWQKLQFGVAMSKYFVEERGEEYQNLTVRLFAEGRITKSDFEALKYIQSLHQAAGAIITFPSAV